MLPRVEWKVAVLLFCSGACALVYQTIWEREFRLLFGVTTAASAAVIEIFIGGLGLGALVLGPRADRHPRPLALYATLEAIVACAAATTPLLVDVARRAYVGLGGTSALGPALAAIVHLGLASIVLAVPTVAMGGCAGEKRICDAIPRRIADSQAHAPTEGQRSESPFVARPPIACPRVVGARGRARADVRPERTASCLVTI
jgi:hypothetical protein